MAHRDGAPPGGGYPSIALDVYGYPHIARDGVWYAYKDGAGWHTEQVDVAGGHTSIALDASGYPHISYWVNGIGVKYAYKDGAGWHTETVDGRGGNGYTSIALDTSGQPYISYSDTSIWDSYIECAYKVGANWNIDSSIDHTPNGSRVSTAVDTSGYPHISYCESYWNYDLRYAYKDGTGWHTETVDSAGDVGYYSSLALDTSNRPHISYCDGTNRDLKYAYKDGAGWHTEVVNSTGDVGSYTSMALDASGRPHISYFDGTNSALKYARTITLDFTHGQFSATTDACAGCHVAHAAQMPNLLKQGPTQTHFCFLCHGDGATSAPYDVKDGYTRTAVSGAVYPSTAGGFVYQFVDANANFAVDGGELKPVTSRHNVWGFVYGDESGAVQDTADRYHWIPGGSDQLTGSGFVCTSCHDPHDGGTVPDGGYITGSATNPNPRLLRRSITVQDATYTSLYVKFSGSWENDGNRGSYYVTSYDSATSKWCGACHNKLQTDDASNKAGEGEAVQYFGMWRHPIGSHVLRGSVTDESLATGTPVLKGLNCGARQVGCLSCHRAHSSAVVMEEGSWAASWPREAADPATGKAQGDTSALLRMDNRGTCYNCHGSGQRNCRNDPFYDSLDCSSCHPYTGSGAHPIMGDCNGCHNW